MNFRVVREGTMWILKVSDKDFPPGWSRKAANGTRYNGYVQEQWWFQARWVDRPLEKWSVSGVSAPRSSTSPSSWSDIGIVSLKDRSSHFWLSKMPKPLRLEKLHPGIPRLWDCMWTQAILRPRLSGLPHPPGSPTSMKTGPSTELFWKN